MRKQNINKGKTWEELYGKEYSDYKRKNMGTTKKGKKYKYKQYCTCKSGLTCDFCKKYASLRAYFNKDAFHTGLTAKRTLISLWNWFKDLTGKEYVPITRRKKVITGLTPTEEITYRRIGEVRLSLK